MNGIAMFGLTYRLIFCLVIYRKKRQVTEFDSNFVFESDPSYFDFFFSICIKYTKTLKVKIVFIKSLILTL